MNLLQPACGLLPLAGSHVEVRHVSRLFVPGMNTGAISRAGETRDHLLNAGAVINIEGNELHANVIQTPVRHPAPINRPLSDLRLQRGKRVGATQIASLRLSSISHYAIAYPRLDTLLLYAMKQETYRFIICS
jgi:hypothetical protein